MSVLALDTTTPALHMGIFGKEGWLAKRSLACDSHRYHSALITPAIRDMLDEAGLTARNLGGLALNLGPGGFTGIRTGVVTVRTMAQFLDIPVFALNAFELLAYDAGVSGPVSVYLDALRGRAYHAVLSFTPDGPVYRTPPTLIAFSPEHPQREAGLEQTLCLLSGSLADSLPSDICFPIRRIPGDFFSPEPMRGLIARYEGIFRKPWPDVLPLYIQEPSVTLKAPKL